MFEVGDMVVCVAKPMVGNFCYEDETQPDVGGVYTVRAVALSPTGQEGIHLREITNAPREYALGFHELYFLSSRFRKIRKPSIEIFREIVASVKGGAHVE